MQTHQIIVPIPIRHQFISSPGQNNNGFHIIPPTINTNEMMFRYPIMKPFGQFSPLGHQMNHFNLNNQVSYPHFQKRVVITKPTDDPRPSCVEGEYCHIFSDHHNSKLWHPPRKEPTPVTKKILPTPPEGETRPVCANGVDCKIHSKAHHSKLWHPPIQCKFGNNCKFHEKNECVYQH